MELDLDRPWAYPALLSSADHEEYVQMWELLAEDVSLLATNVTTLWAFSKGLDRVSQPDDLRLLYLVFENMGAYSLLVCQRLREQHRSGDFQSIPIFKAHLLGGLEEPWRTHIKNRWKAARDSLDDPGLLNRLGEVRSSRLAHVKRDPNQIVRPSDFEVEDVARLSSWYCLQLEALTIHRRPPRTWERVGFKSPDDPMGRLIDRLVSSPSST